jgi:hypothetical protein
MDDKTKNEAFFQQRKRPTPAFAQENNWYHHSQTVPGFLPVQLLENTDCLNFIRLKTKRGFQR